MFMKPYRNYNFLTKDPVIDAMRTVIKSEEKLKNAEAHAITGVATATFENWFNGTTCKPQNATVCQAMGALGYLRRDTFDRNGVVTPAFVKGRMVDRAAEIEKQAVWHLKYAAAKKKLKKPRAKKANGHAK